MVHVGLAEKIADGSVAEVDVQVAEHFLEFGGFDDAVVGGVHFFEEEADLFALSRGGGNRVARHRRERDSVRRRNTNANRENRSGAIRVVVGNGTGVVTTRRNTRKSVILNWIATGNGSCGSRSTAGLASGENLFLRFTEVRIVLEDVELAELSNLRGREDIVPGAVGVLVNLDLLDAEGLDALAGGADGDGFVGEGGLEGRAEFAQGRSSSREINFEVDFLTVEIGSSEECKNHF